MHEIMYFHRVYGIWAMRLFEKQSSYRDTDGQIFTLDPCSFCKIILYWRSSPT